MSNSYEVTYPDEIIEVLYEDFSKEDKECFTFEEYCYLKYGQYMANIFKDKPTNKNFLI